MVAQIRQDFSDCHSAYYQPGWKAQRDAGHETAVFAVLGWTDDLLEAVESFRMFKYLSGSTRVGQSRRCGDVGHARAQNKPSTWRSLNNQANQFLNAHISGSHPQQTTVFSQPTLCATNPDPGPDTAAQQLTATTPEGLSIGTLDVVGPPVDGDPSGCDGSGRPAHRCRRPVASAATRSGRTNRSPRATAILDFRMGVRIASSQDGPQC